MKNLVKLFALSAVMVVAGCQSYPCQEEECAAQPVQPVQEVRQEPRRVVVYRDEAPAPVYYRQQARRVNVICDEMVASPCAEQVRVVREPVEVVYKRTQLRTVYEPKTYKDVTYEREPYTGQDCPSCDQQVVVETPRSSETVRMIEAPRRVITKRYIAEEEIK